MNLLRWPSIWWTAFGIYAFITAAGPWTWPAWPLLELQFTSPSVRAEDAYNLYGVGRRGQLTMEIMDFLSPFLYVPAMMATAKKYGARSWVPTLAVATGSLDLSQNLLVIGMMETGSAGLGWALIFVVPVLAAAWVASFVLALQKAPSKEIKTDRSEF